METTHTPEPWLYTHGSIYTAPADGSTPIRLLQADRDNPATAPWERDRNLERAAACVNACAGMTDPAADIAALRGMSACPSGAASYDAPSMDDPEPVVPSGPVFLAVYIGTTNDTNGNPRRGWYVSRLDGQEVARSKVGKLGETAPVYTAWVEEGYNGTSAPVDAVARVLGMPTKTWNDIAAVRALVHETGRINVTPGEYRDARKLPRFGGAA